MRDRNEISSIHGPYGLLRRLDPEHFQADLMEAAQETKDIIESEIVRRTPVDSGNLERGIKTELIVDGQGRYRIVASAVATNKDGEDYAPYVEDGTGVFGPHRQMIEAKSPKGMRFFWKRPGMARDYGGFRYGAWRMHRIAGQKPKRYLHLGWRSGMRFARDRFRQLLKEL